MSKKTNVLRFILFAAIILHAAPVVHAADWFSINGYCKSFFTALDWPDVDYFEDGEYYATDDAPMNSDVNNRLRLKTVARIRDWMSLTAAYDFSPRAESNGDSGSTSFWLRSIAERHSSYRVKDIRSRLYPGPHDHAGNFSIYQNRVLLAIK